MHEKNRPIIIGYTTYVSMMLPIHYRNIFFRGYYDYEFGMTMFHWRYF